MVIKHRLLVACALFAFNAIQADQLSKVHKGEEKNYKGSSAAKGDYILDGKLIKDLPPPIKVPLDSTAPVLRYTFDKPYGFYEENAISPSFPAEIKRANFQQFPAKREKGLFGNALRHGNRSAVYAKFPAKKVFTLSFWLKAEALNGSNIYSCQDSFSLSIDRHKSKLYLRVLDRNISGNFKLNDWFCVTVSSDGKELKLYLGGDFKGKIALAANFSPFNKNVLFSNNAAAHHQFTGLFDELCVYDTQLSHEQIKQISNPQKALDHLPPIADAGIDHSIYLEADGQVSLKLMGKIKNGLATETYWYLDKGPHGITFPIQDAYSTAPTLHFKQPGEYFINLKVQTPTKISTDQLKVIVFPALEQKTEIVDTSVDFNSFKPPRWAEKSSLYTAEFVSSFFPHLEAKFQHEGFAKERFKSPPPAYQHPRVFFNHDDLPAMRRRLRYTKAGQSAIAKVRTSYEMNTRGTQGIPKDYIIAKKGKDGKASFNMDTGAAAQYCNGAFLALIDLDKKLARKLIEGAVGITDLQLEVLENASVEKRRNWQNFGHNLLGRYATSYIYDFLYPWMTELERRKIRKVISLATSDVYSIGMNSVAGGHGSSNWVCWVSGDLLANICAIEGEEGFDKEVYQGAMKAMKNFYTYGINPDGSSYEGMGKNSLTPQNLLVMSKRGEASVAYENVYNHIAKFHLHIMQPFGYKFIVDDLWGTSRHPGRPADAAVLKFAYPNDPVIDFVYRNIVKDDYQISELNRTYVYTSGLVNCWVGEDWTGDQDWNKHAKNIKEKSQHFNYTNIAVARTDWNRDAAFLYFLPRMLGGHNSPARGTFIFSALGRDWSMYPIGHNNKSNLQHSVITVDNKSAPARSARMTHYDDNSQRMISSCDLRHVYGSKSLKNANAYRLKPTSEPWNDLPGWKTPNWQNGYKPNAELEPVSFEHLRPDVLSAFRTISLVKAEKPYTLILDEMNIDSKKHHYRWQMVLPPDLKDCVEIKGNDFIVTDRKTGNYVVVRLLNNVPGAKLSYELNDIKVKALAIETEGVKSRFEVMIMAMRKGESLPSSNQPMLSKTMAEMKAILNDQIQEAKEALNQQLSAFEHDSAGFSPTELGESIPYEMDTLSEIPLTEGFLSKALHFDSKNHCTIKGSLVPPFKDRSPFTVTFWTKADKASHATIYNNNGFRGLAIGLHQGKHFKVSFNGNWYWHTSPDLSKNWWTKITATFDGNIFKFYVNDTLMQTEDKVTTMAPAKEASIGQAYPGKVEDLLFFNKALSEEQIKKWYAYEQAQFLQKSL